MRFSLLLTELQGFARSAHQWAVSNNQSAAGISNIVGSALRVTTIGKFDDWISLRNLSIFCQSTGGTPTATRKIQLKRGVQCASIDASLPARNYFKRTR